MIRQFRLVVSLRPKTIAIAAPKLYQALRQFIYRLGGQSPARRIQKRIQGFRRFIRLYISHLYDFRKLHFIVFNLPLS
jgi:hypothetical protein